jgi:hypothetical protein
MSSKNSKISIRPSFFTKAVQCSFSDAQPSELRMNETGIKKDISHNIKLSHSKNITEGLGRSISDGEMLLNSSFGSS